MKFGAIYDIDGFWVGSTLSVIGCPERRLPAPFSSKISEFLRNCLQFLVDSGEHFRAGG
jgi:hypothetical protein